MRLRIAKMKPIFLKAARTEGQTTLRFLFLPLILMIMQKLI